MTPEELDAIDLLCQKATPGPWEEYPRGPEFENAWCQGVAASHRVNICGMHDGGRTVNGSERRDAEFIAQARTLLPELVAELRTAQRNDWIRLKAENTELRARIAAVEFIVNNVARVSWVAIPDLRPRIRRALNPESPE